MDNEKILVKHWYHFLAPRFWPTWIIIGLLRISVFLPYSMMLFFGKRLGRLLMHLAHSRKNIAKVNLTLCFPELSAEERNRLLKKSFESIGIGFFETALAWWGSNKRLKKMVIIQGQDNLEKVKKDARGTLTPTCHFTSIELGIRFFTFITKANLMYRPQKNTLFEWILQKRRARYVNQSIHRRDIRKMLQALRDPEAVMCYTPDQDSSKHLSVFAPFFGIPASTITATSYFAKKIGCDVIPVFYYRDEKTKKYILDCHPTVNEFPTENDITDATRINKIIESAIRKYPEQYMWTHRRFKTQPDGAAKASLYQKLT